MQVCNPELDIAFGPARDDKWGTDRSGFTVLAEIKDTSEHAGYVDAFEGYSLGTQDEQEVIVEPETLHLQYVSAVSRTASTPNTRTAGIGTALVREAILHGIGLGLMRGRAEAINPRIITILQKLEQEGTIGELELYAGWPLLQSVDRLRETGEYVTAKYAKEYLTNRTALRGAWRQDYCIRTLFEI